MITKEVVINNQVGLHARPATFFIQKANEFKSSIWIEKEDRRVNAKSLLGVLSLGIVKGTAVNLLAHLTGKLVVDGMAWTSGDDTSPCPSGCNGRAAC